MSGLHTRINGRQIQDNVLYDTHVNAAAAIQETKLALDFTTASLYTGSLRTDVNRTVADGVTISFPYIHLRDTVNGKTYKLYLENGTVVTVEV